MSPRAQLVLRFNGNGIQKKLPDSAFTDGGRKIASLQKGASSFPHFFYIPAGVPQHLLPSARDSPRHSHPVRLSSPHVPPTSFATSPCQLVLVFSTAYRCRTCARDDGGDICIPAKIAASLNEIRQRSIGYDNRACSNAKRFR